MDTPIYDQLMAERWAKATEPHPDTPIFNELMWEAEITGEIAEDTCDVCGGITSTASAAVSSLDVRKELDIWWMRERIRARTSTTVPSPALHTMKGH